MEPIHPQLRTALKRVHPGLTDEDIDRYEELVSLRFLLDPETQANAIREVDEERNAIIREKMPKIKEVTRAFTPAPPSAASRPSQEPRIEIKPPLNRENPATDTNELSE
jgi:hypothetical protein